MVCKPKDDKHLHKAMTKSLNMGEGWGSQLRKDDVIYEQAL